MTFGSNRRRASRRRILFPLMILLLLPAAVSQAEDAGGTAPDLFFAADVRADARLEQWLRADREWLAATAPAGPLDSATVSVSEDSLDAGAVARLPLLSALSRRWRLRGHLACEARPADDDRGDRAIVLDPGPAFRYGRIDVQGETFANRSALLLRYLPASGDLYEPERLDESVTRLLDAMGEAGYPFARWILRRVKIDPQAAVVDLSAILSSGRSAVLGAESCSLESPRALTFLRKVTRLREGAVFRESDLIAARQRLMRREIYAEVGEPVVHAASTPDTVNVYWPVRPRTGLNRLSVILGLQRASAEQPARVSGQIDLEMRNIADSGRGLALAWSDDGRDRSHLSADWREPLVRGTPLDVLGALDHEVLENVYTRFRFDLGTEMGIVGRWLLTFGMGHDRNTFPTGTWVRSARWRARAAIERRRPDIASSGWGARAEVQSASRNSIARDDSTYADGLDGRAGQERQTLLDLAFDGEWWLDERLSLAAGILFKGVDSDAGVLPLSEHYRLGGARSLRGYREDQFHGDRIGALRLEMRLGRAHRSRLYTFFDIGYFRYAGPDAADPDGASIRITEETLRGFGLGLETRTAGGELSLAIGFPGSFAFDDAKLHVRHRQTF